MKSTILSVDRLAVLALFATCFSSLSLAAPAVERPALEKRALPVVLGSAKAFGALAATTLTNSDFTVITGKGGVWPGNAITGFPPGTATTLEAGTVVAQKGQGDCLIAYNNAQSITPTTALPSSNLGGITLGPGAYTFPSLAVTLSGILTLDAGNIAGKQFIFKIGTTFAPAALSSVRLIGKAQACNIYFIVGSSATIGAGAKMQGNIIAYTTIGAASGASNSGTWCALNGAVNLIKNPLIAQAGVCPT